MWPRRTVTLNERPDDGGDPVLRADDVGLVYSDGDRVVHALSAITLRFGPRGFHGVIGPSGSGKSSLLYVLAGLRRPSSGDVAFGESVYRRMGEAQLAALRRARFGFVFQQPYLIGYLTARENVVAACTGRDGEEIARVDDLFEVLGIADLRSAYPHQLSGGERQRVCVARAMANRPQVIFADEPTASLDHVNGHAVMNLLSAYRDRGAVIVVTHDLEMLAGADRIVRMRDGAIERQAPPVEARSG
ncbi:MAG TPA: ABC transporter ATP-binding protein [Chthonomonadales bacterium]|nr:ABC transporter ATP-binding protein [Chthonomonadales bacterium]